MTGAQHRGNPYRRRRAAPATARVVTTSDWLSLLALATACASEAGGGAEADDARRRLATLANRMNAASPEMFDRNAGAATADVARAFIRVGRAFAHPVTPDERRREMADMVADMAAFLDKRIHAMATDAFRAAHVGRPEVWR